MARPRKPTAILLTSGAFRKNPARLRARSGEPKVVGDIGKPPARLTNVERQAWRELIRSVHRGTVGLSDRLALESFARLVAKDWNGLLTAAERSALTGFFTKFGLTPSDRARINAPLEEDENAFANLDGERA